MDQQKSPPQKKREGCHNIADNINIKLNIYIYKLKNKKKLAVWADTLLEILAFHFAKQELLILPSK